MKHIYFTLKLKEGSHSGLVRRTRNAVGEKSPQRFKSSTLRIL